MPILYRFFPAKTALLSVESRSLRVGRIAELNDPFDCAPHFKGADPAQAAACEEIARKLSAARNDSRGVLCFTRTWREPVLWSHYADHHRGIALAFSFKGHRPDLLPVKYRIKRPTIAYEALLNPERKHEVSAKLGQSHSVKSKTWSYERECRLVVPLDRCRMTGGVYFMEFDQTFFRGVILGLRCSANVADVRRTCAHAGFPGVQIWRVVKSPTGFSLDREEA